MSFSLYMSLRKTLVSAFASADSRRSAPTITHEPHTRFSYASPVPRYKLTIAYDGTDFCGWQKQEPFAPDDDPRPADQRPANVEGDAWTSAESLPPREGEERPRVALRTVQHVVEQAVRAVVREPVVLMGASRTDTGVHARGQVAAFTCSDSESERAPSVSAGPSASVIDDAPLRGAGWPLSRGVDRLMLAINSRLPEDVQIVACEPADPDFNPIRGATSKAYSYTFHAPASRDNAHIATHDDASTTPRSILLPPLWDRKYVHCVRDALDIAAMNAAAQHLVGEHDFAALAAANHGRLSTVRTIFWCRVRDITPSEAQAQAWAATTHVSTPFSSSPSSSAALAAPARRIRIDVCGNGFLYNMVRIIAGTLFEVGRARMTPDDVAAAIESRDRRNAGPTLPPRGLCLEWVKYASP